MTNRKPSGTKGRITQSLDLRLVATCLDERASDECEILFIKGEREDVQVTDAEHLWWLLTSGPSLLTWVLRPAGAWSTRMNSSIKISESHRLSAAMLSFLLSPYASGFCLVDTLYEVIFSHRNDVLSWSCASTSRTIDRVKERLMWVGCCRAWLDRKLSVKRQHLPPCWAKSKWPKECFLALEAAGREGGKLLSMESTSFHCPLLGSSLETQWWYWHEQTIGHTLSPTSNYLLN